MKTFLASLAAVAFAFALSGCECDKCHKDAKCTKCGTPECKCVCPKCGKSAAECTCPKPVCPKCGKTPCVCPK